MDIGKKILELRKEKNFSQEELAEKIDVTRQTISKWELGETSPDISQAKKLSNIFNVSLDELVNNDTKDIIMEKVSNTENNSKKILKLFRNTIIIIVILLILFIGYLVLFRTIRQEQREIMGTMSIVCSLDGEEYSWEMEYNKNYEPINSGGSAFIDFHIDITKYQDVHQIVAHIEDYFKDHGGSCKITDSNE